MHCREKAGWDGIGNAKMRFEIWNLRSEISDAAPLLDNVKVLTVPSCRYDTNINADTDLIPIPTLHECMETYII